VADRNVCPTRGGIRIIDEICRRLGLRGGDFCVCGVCCLFGELAVDFVGADLEDFLSLAIGEQAFDAAAEDLIIPFGFLHVELFLLFFLAEALEFPAFGRVGTEGDAVAEVGGAEALQEPGAGAPGALAGMENVFGESGNRLGLGVFVPAGKGRTCASFFSDGGGADADESRGAARGEADGYEAEEGVLFDGVEDGWAAGARVQGSRRSGQALFRVQGVCGGRGFGGFGGHVWVPGLRFQVFLAKD
jgi:hypothetical protein